MWRTAGLICSRRAQESCRLGLRATAPKRPLSTQHTRNISYDASPHRRFFTIVTAFGAGFSVYFFLEDPSRGAPTMSHVSLSPRQFISSRLISSEDSGQNSKLLTLAIPLHSLPPDNHEIFGPIWSVYIKDDDIQVERPYTPLNGIDEDGRMVFWVKKYPKGEVGRWLHAKQPGQHIELRGPLKTWPWKEDSWDEIVMVSGGTGITPFIQLFNTKILKLSPTSTTRFTLLHSSRTPGELPPAALLDPLTAFAKENPDKFRFHVFVDEDDGSKADASIPPFRSGRINERSMEQCLNSERQPISWWSQLFSRNPPQKVISERILFLVCGPEPMIGAIAGPYGRNLSQGPIGGVLGNLGYTSSQVYKL